MEKNNKKIISMVAYKTKITCKISNYAIDNLSTRYVNEFIAQMFDDNIEKFKKDLQKKLDLLDSLTEDDFEELIYELEEK